MKRYFYYFLLIMILCSCSVARAPSPKLEDAVKAFSEAMRWGEYRLAARQLAPELRDGFLQQFTSDDDDLHIVESRAEWLQFFPETQTAKASYQIEYYLLPSSRLKKWRWEQDWYLLEGKLAQPGTWLIRNPPPAFP